ncbi:beta-lactamase/transpeptidase-like protein [Obelidium mucronatum]|nr:beta-lactamase/transpeptidase-like protein [Obelidium mucronatum]
MLGLNPPPESKVVGFTAVGYESMREIMRQGFQEGYDLGSQFAAYVDGELVVDIAGGFTDRTYTTPYTTNTLQQVFSSSKFVTSVVFLHLVETKRLALSDLVVKYWPEFGKGGKGHVTVGLLLQHHGGVAFLDPERVPSLANKIAGQKHNFDGKEVSAYHAVTRGWYLNEIARRATGMSVRQIMYKEILPRLNNGTKVFGVEDHTDVNGTFPYEFHYGIPDSPASLSQSVRSRVAPLDSSPFIYKLVHILTPPWVFKLFGEGFIPTAIIKAYTMKGTFANKSLFSSGPAFTATKEFPWSYNDPTCRRSESPSFNGLTNARTLNSNCRTRPPARDMVVNNDLIFTKIGTGVFKKGFGWGTKYATGDGIEFYGWAGAGGSLVVFSTEYNVAFSYAMNFAHLQTVGDRRSWRLIREQEKRNGKVTRKKVNDEL